MTPRNAGEMIELKRQFRIPDMTEIATLGNPLAIEGLKFSAPEK